MSHMWVVLFAFWQAFAAVALLVVAATARGEENKRYRAYLLVGAAVFGVWGAADFFVPYLSWKSQRELNAEKYDATNRAANLMFEATGKRDWHPPDSMHYSIIQGAGYGDIAPVIFNLFSLPLAREAVVMEEFDKLAAPILSKNLDEKNPTDQERFLEARVCTIFFAYDLAVPSAKWGKGWVGPVEVYDEPDEKTGEYMPPVAHQMLKDRASSLPNGENIKRCLRFFGDKV